MATWTLVAHASGARFYRTREGALSRIKELEHPEGRRPDEMWADRQGRSDTGHGRTAYEPHTTAREQVTTTFARVLAGELGELVRGDTAPSVVVVAPHKLLHAIKEELPTPLARQVTRWDARDFAHLDDAAVGEALSHA